MVVKELETRTVRPVSLRTLFPQKRHVKQYTVVRLMFSDPNRRGSLFQVGCNNSYHVPASILALLPHPLLVFFFCTGPSTAKFVSYPEISKHHGNFTSVLISSRSHIKSWNRQIHASKNRIPALSQSVIMNCSWKLTRKFCHKITAESTDPPGPSMEEPCHVSVSTTPRHKP